jgi:surface carbohydrate biosynthesis protein
MMAAPRTARAPRPLRIALTVNHPQRDLAGIVLTARALCQRGATCFLTPANLQEWEIWALAPDFVVLHYARRGIDEFVRRLVRAGIPFGVLDAEGGVWESCDAYTELLWPDRTLLAQARPFCAWGPALAEHLVKTGLLSGAQVSVTGCPRFDFYHRDWRAVLAGAVESGSRPRILINTNFSMVNPRFVTADRNRANMQAVYGWDAARIDMLLQREQRAIADTIAMAGSLAVDFPGCQLIVRPHPFESARPYTDGLRHLNIEVDPGGPVQPQIARASLVIQRSCTTALESAFSGTPTLSPQWIDPPFLMPAAEKVSVPCDDYLQLRSRVAAILEGRFERPPAIDAAIALVTREWFFAIDGRAHARAADAILEHATSSTRIDRRACARYLYGIEANARHSLKEVGRWVRLTLGLTPHWSFRRMRRVAWTTWDGTDKAFTAADVARLLQRIEQAVPDQDRVPVAVTTASDECAHGYDGRSVRMALAA